MNSDSIDLAKKAHWVWRETLAIHRSAPETRLASSLSAVEIFVALYYGGVLCFDSKRPLWEERDRCIISKGHGSICLYPILADLGFFSSDELQDICKKGSFLGAIPDPIIPGYETVNGSLGHGLGVGTGIALGLQRLKLDRQVFVVIGDGELHEGANWEAIMFASQHRLENLNVIIDNNRISMLGYTDDIVSHGALEKRFNAFGWDAGVADGHDVNALRDVLLNMKKRLQRKPKVLIANTRKGRGVPNLENAEMSHVMTADPVVLDRLLEE